MPWVLDPHSGGTKIPPRMHETLKRKITDHATKKYSGKFERINVRFSLLSAHKKCHFFEFIFTTQPISSIYSLQYLTDSKSIFDHHLSYL
jgi:hypothetical protein